MRSQRSGFILLLTLILMIALSAIASSLIVSLSTNFRNTSIQSNDAKSVMLAEAGLHKAIWNLMTPTGSTGQGENWTTTGTTESLGDGTYTMVVDRWNFALSLNSSSATASSTAAGLPASNAIDGSNFDGNLATYWESSGTPTQSITVQFPYPMRLNKVRFSVPAGFRTPQNYAWQVSSDNVTYTTVKTVRNNACSDRTDTFATATNVSYLRLRVTSNNSGGGTNRVRIATIDAVMSRITSTGTVSSQNREVQQTISVIDGVTVPTCSTVTTPAAAYRQINWNEVFTT